MASTLKVNTIQNAAGSNTISDGSPSIDLWRLSANFSSNATITGWERPDGTTVTEDRNGTPTNVDNLTEEEYVSLDYHQYETDTSTLGFEQGEQWRASIHPFREDFRIQNPPGSNNGL